MLKKLHLSFHGVAWHAVVGRDLKQNIHAHGVPPLAEVTPHEALRARKMV
jgi:hypothetical protein